MSTDRESKIFANRAEGGRRLAEQLRNHVEPESTVLGLSRGGVPVAFEVARELALPLDMIVVSRLGIPWQPEVAMGALAEGGARVIDEQAVDAAMVSPHDIETVEHHEREQLGQCIVRLRAGRAPRRLGGQSVLIVDDGLATGASARAACQAAHARGATRVVVAVPVASSIGLLTLAPFADDVLALQTPTDFVGVGQAYVDFSQTDEDEVRSLLAASDEFDGLTAPDDAPGPLDEASRRSPSATYVREIALPIGEVTLAGRLREPANAQGLVIVAHDSSRERHSSGSQYLSGVLAEVGFATLLIDLLTEDEEAHGDRYLAISMLADRLRMVTQAFRSGYRQVDYLASGVAAAIVLEAAARPESDIHAVAGLAGRLDLAAHPGAVRAPTLLVVGEQDSAIAQLNLQGAQRLSCPHRLVTMAGTGRRFREPGALQHAAAEVSAWFLTSEFGTRTTVRSSCR
jgi:putative phosphoribosyl transferase